MIWKEFTFQNMPDFGKDIWVRSFCNGFMYRCTPLRIEVGKNGHKSLLCYKYPIDAYYTLYEGQMWCYTEELL